MLNGKLRDFIGFIANYVILLAGLLSVLMLALLASLLGVYFMPKEVVDALSVALMFPLVIDFLIISPQLPVLLLILVILPFLLNTLVFLRVAIPRLSSALRYLSLRSGLRLRPPLVHAGPGERRLGLRDAFLIGLGAALGPSVFVLTPNSVRYYGWYSLPGLWLAVISAYLLAYGYRTMFRYSTELGMGAVGGPAFIRNAFGRKHYLYIIARFSMWIMNTATAAFNLLIILDIVSEYAVPYINGLLGLGDHVYGFAARMTAFAIISYALLRIKDEGAFVTLQRVITAPLIPLFFVHVASLLLASGKPLTLGGPEVGRGPLWGVLATLSSAAYIYMMISRFQDLQAISEDIEPERRGRVLWLSMLVTICFTAALLTFYTLVLVSLSSAGVEIPGTPIPAVDLALRACGRLGPALAAFTMGLVVASLLTTFIPAFMMATRHLRELLSDVFAVRLGAREQALYPIIIVAFMFVLSIAGAEHVIHLTDFTVIVAMIVVALSEGRLGGMALGRVAAASRFRAYLTAGILTVMVLAFAYGNFTLVLSSLFSVLIATIVLMLLSYDLRTVEMFAVAITVIALVTYPPLTEVIAAMADVGLATPYVLAISPLLTVGIQVLRLTLAAMVIHLAYGALDVVIPLSRAAARYLRDGVRALRTALRRRRAAVPLA